MIAQEKQGLVVSMKMLKKFQKQANISFFLIARLNIAYKL